MTLTPEQKAALAAHRAVLLDLARSRKDARVDFSSAHYHLVGAALAVNAAHPSPIPPGSPYPPEDPVAVEAAIRARDRAIAEDPGWVEAQRVYEEALTVSRTKTTAAEARARETSAAVLETFGLKVDMEARLKQSEPDIWGGALWPQEVVRIDASVTFTRDHLDHLAWHGDITIPASDADIAFVAVVGDRLRRGQVPILSLDPRAR